MSLFNRLLGRQPPSTPPSGEAAPGVQSAKDAAARAASDVPPHYMRGPLVNWSQAILDERDDWQQRVELKIRAPFREWTIDQLYDVVSVLLQLIDEEAGGRLGPDWAIRDHGFVEYAFGSQPWWRWVNDLERLLTDAGSVYRVSRSPLSLQRRIAAADGAALEAAVGAGSTSARPDAGADLAAAWDAAFGRHPDPSRAYGLAIRAVEHVAVPVVLPKDKLATLGKVRRSLADTADRWTVDVGGGLNGAALVAMVAALWHGQDDRHGGQPDYSRVTQEQAEGAVQLAVLLTRWFAEGRVRRLT